MARLTMDRIGVPVFGALPFVIQEKALQEAFQRPEVRRLGGSKRMKYLDRMVPKYICDAVLEGSLACEYFRG